MMVYIIRKKGTDQYWTNHSCWGERPMARLYARDSHVRNAIKLGRKGNHRLHCDVVIQKLWMTTAGEIDVPFEGDGS